MKSIMMKVFIALTANLVFLAVVLGSIAYHSAARAEEPEPTPTQMPESVVIVTVSAETTPKPETIEEPQAIIYDYSIGISHIETVARAIYNVDDEQDKIGVICLFVNRAYCQKLRADGKRLFPASITGVVIQPGEVEFYDSDAPVTAANYALAEYVINAQITYIMTKQYTGIIFPSNLLYMGWINGEVVFYTERGGEPWRYLTSKNTN